MNPFAEAFVIVGLSLDQLCDNDVVSVSVRLIGLPLVEAS